MQPPRPCLLSYDERTGIGCDLRQGHEGPCRSDYSRAEAIRRLEDELFATERALYAARGETPPRNRRERRMRR